MHGGPMCCRYVQSKVWSCVTLSFHFSLTLFEDKKCMAVYHWVLTSVLVDFSKAVYNILWKLKYMINIYTYAIIYLWKKNLLHDSGANLPLHWTYTRTPHPKDLHTKREKWKFVVRVEYFLILGVSAELASLLGPLEDVDKLDGARVSEQVKSQTTANLSSPPWN